MPLDLLVVDDDDDFRSTVVRRLCRRGFPVQEASSAEQALDLAERRHFVVAVVDMVMPGMSGLNFLERLRAAGSDCKVIFLTGQGTIESAVEAMKLGAYDYLQKPCPLADLERVILRAGEHYSLEKENLQLRAVLQRARQGVQMIGQSPAVKELFRLIERAGPTDKAILIQGESGTGKELVARSLHQCSLRADKPIVVVNCAALPETLLESELFGHEKGSFTGAISAKQGLFEVADNGTLMIDEIGEMPGSLQAKLLRVLEDGSFRRVGSLKERRVNVRLLAATNRNMMEEVRAGRFREDLYYRINVMSLQVAPLRDRREDLPLLVEHFLGPEWQLADGVMSVLERYTWPGNVRQLINALERAKILADNKTVRLDDLPHEVVSQVPATGGGAHADPSDHSLASIERAHIVEVLAKEGGNKVKTARALGINRRSLYRLLEKYGLS